MAKVACLTLACFICIQAFGQRNVEFLKDANAVVLYNNTTLEVTSTSDYSIEQDYTIKLLNRYATAEKELYFHYDDFSSLKKVQIEVFDGSNRLIETFKLKDLNDLSTGSGVASDSRAKYIRVVTNKYPIFIRVSSRIEHSGSLHFPTWDPQPNENLAVISGSFQIINHTENPVRFFDINVPQPTTSNGIPHLTKWVIDSIKAYNYESFSDLDRPINPVVYTAPSNFQIAGIPGAMATWNEFGEFIEIINSGKNNLNEEQKQVIKNLVNEDDSAYEKVRKIYSYLQEMTRYVSIQLGIGGWAPFDASFVHDKKYGDCKALSFYTKSALEEVGIQSYYTLIRARPFADPILQSFPNAHFNHAILTVPIEQDTVWLECTSQTSPFGYMGTFTGNRKALLIDGSRSKLINTKIYSAQDNQQITNVNLSIALDGTAKVGLIRNLYGLEIENDNFHNLINESRDEAEKWFYDHLEIGDIEIEKFTIHPVSQNTIPKTGYNIELNLKNGATMNGNRLFIRPALFTNIDYYNLSSEVRTTDIQVKYGYTQVDSINIELPKYFSSESMITPTYLETKYGSYQIEISLSENVIKYTRKFVLKNGHYSKEFYPDFVEFIKSVQKFDRQKLVLLDRT